MAELTAKQRSVYRVQFKYGTRDDSDVFHGIDITGLTPHFVISGQHVVVDSTEDDTVVYGIDAPNGTFSVRIGSDKTAMMSGTLNYFVELLDPDDATNTVQLDSGTFTVGWDA